jgi:molybdate transport system ATP-binding protein
MTAPATPVFVHIEHATFRGPNGPIFADTTLSIEAGQRWALLGPNGSGKGALVAGLMGKLGLLGGVLRHPFLEGRPGFEDSVFGVHPPGSMALASMQEHRRWLLARDFHQLRWHGSLSQGRATVGAMLERGQVEQRNPFAVLDPGDDATFAQVRAREIARFDLEPLLSRPLVALSNGELHRFVLARALMRRPRLLFLDEPLAGLDQPSRNRLLTTLDELHAEGMGVVIATEREDDLPGGISHVARVESFAVRGAGARASLPRAATPVEPAQIRAMPPRRARPLGPDIPILDMQDVSVRQGSVTLLDGISLTVAQGEHWALLGENGSGKSTLLSLVLADNPQVYANAIRIAGHGLGPGRSIWDQKAWLGWLSPELEAHYPLGTPNIEVVLSGFLSSLGVHTSFTEDRQSTAWSWLDAVGLRGHAHTPIAELAPADRRLVLLARAAVHGPSLLLFDEPCQGLDGAGRARVLAAIAAVTDALSAAMIYVTHDLTEIPASVAKLLVLAHGRPAYRGARADWQTPGGPAPMPFGSSERRRG